MHSPLSRRPTLLILFADKTARIGGLIDLKDHTISDQVKTANLANRWTQMDDATPLALAVKDLQKPRIRIPVGIEAASGKARARFCAHTDAIDRRIALALRLVDSGRSDDRCRSCLRSSKGLPVESLISAHRPVYHRPRLALFHHRAPDRPDSSWQTDKTSP